MPYYLICTKGYGFTVQDINQGCPKDFEPYIAAHKALLKKQDEQMWYMGLYVNNAVAVAVDHCLHGEKAKSEYLKEPIMRLQEVKETAKRNLTEEEKQREVDRFFAQEKVRRVNWRRAHRRPGDGKARELDSNTETDK